MKLSAYLLFLVGLVLATNTAHARSSIVDLLRENWAAMQENQQQLARDISTIEDLKRKLPATTYSRFLSDAAKAVDSYEQKLYELRRDVPPSTIPFLEGRTETEPPGDTWNRLVRAITKMKAELPTLRTNTLLTPLVNSMRQHNGADGIAMLRTHVPILYDTYVEGRLRQMRETLASDQPPYGASTREGWSLVTDLGWDNAEALELYSLAVCRRWFGPGHDELAGKVAATLRHAEAKNNHPLILNMEALRALDVPKQAAFLQSLLGAYRDAGREAEAGQIIAELINQNDPLAIRLRLQQKPPPRESRALLQRLADANLTLGAEAWTLANYWASGEGGPRDPAVAARLKAIALEKQYPLACREEALRLSKLPANQVDPQRYRELLEISWSSGYKDVASLLFDAAYTSSGRAKSTKLNQAILLAAAEQGNRAAISAVGRHYMNGTDGFTRDPNRALPWLQKSSGFGNHIAPAYLGQIYLYGQIGSTNLREAHAQFRRARDLGYWREPGPHLIAETVIAALEKQVACDTCNGAGRHNGYRTCGDCRGRGSYRCDKCSGRGTTKRYRQESCASCGGSGSIRYSYDTKGEGRLRDYRSQNSRCTSCNGRGNWSVAENVRCSSCGGDGERRCSRCRGKGEIETSGSCNSCGGDGRIIRYDSKKSFSPSEL